MSVVLVSVVTAYPQEKRENKYEEIIANARAKVEAQPHIRRTVQDTFDDGVKEPTETRTWVKEVLSSDREHTSYGLRSTTRTLKWEAIRIGKTEYRRTGDGAWEKREWKEPGSGSGSSTHEIEYSYRGKKDMNGIKADVYERVTRSYVVRHGDRKVSVYRTQYFIGPDGLLLKEISDSDNLITKRMHLETSYETSSTIMIEAPIP